MRDEVVLTQPARLGGICFDSKLDDVGRHLMNIDHYHAPSRRRVATLTWLGAATTHLVDMLTGTLTCDAARCWQAALAQPHLARLAREAEEQYAQARSNLQALIEASEPGRAAELAHARNATADALEAQLRERRAMLDACSRIVEDCAAACEEIAARARTDDEAVRAQRDDFRRVIGEYTPAASSVDGKHWPVWRPRAEEVVEEEHALAAAGVARRAAEALQRWRKGIEIPKPPPPRAPAGDAIAPVLAIRDACLRTFELQAVMRLVGAFVKHERLLSEACAAGG